MPIMMYQNIETFSEGVLQHQEAFQLFEGEKRRLPSKLVCPMYDLKRADNGGMRSMAGREEGDYDTLSSSMH